MERRRNHRRPDRHGIDPLRRGERWDRRGIAGILLHGRVEDGAMRVVVDGAAGTRLIQAPAVAGDRGDDRGVRSTWSSGQGWENSASPAVPAPRRRRRRPRGRPGRRPRRQWQRRRRPRRRLAPGRRRPRGPLRRRLPQRQPRPPRPRRRRHPQRGSRSGSLFRGRGRAPIVIVVVAAADQGQPGGSNLSLRAGSQHGAARDLSLSQGGPILPAAHCRVLSGSRLPLCGIARCKSAASIAHYRGTPPPPVMSSKKEINGLPTEFFGFGRCWNPPLCHS